MIISVAITLDARIPLIQSKLDQFNLSYRWLAGRLERDHVSVANWLQGKSAPRDRKIFNAMISVLTEYEKSAKLSGDLSIRRAGIRIVPVYPGLQAGKPTSVSADVEQIELKDWGTDRERWGRVIDGYSMSPLLEPGDIVIFEDRPSEPNLVVHAFDNGNDTIKIVRGQGEAIQLVPANPEFAAFSGKGWNIKGVAVMRIRKGPHGQVTTDEFPHGLRYVYQA